MDALEQQVSATLKYWSETVLKHSGSGAQFYMSQLIEYVQAAVPGSAPDTVTSVLKGMKERGEVGYAPIMASDGLYQLIPPGQAQTTMFGAPSEPGGNGKKKKPFTKKQKKAAFEELGALPNMGAGLTRLYEWLYEQLN